MQAPRRELFIVTFLYLIIFFFFFLTQERVKKNQGKGYDGRDYYAIAEQYSQNNLSPTTITKENVPYRFRVLPSYCAAAASKVLNVDIINGFFIVNAFANLITILLLYSIFSYSVRNMFIKLGMIAMYCTYSLSPVRFSIFYPCLADPFAMMFVSLMLYQILRYKEKRAPMNFIVLSLAAFFGALTREFTMVLALGFLFLNNPLQIGEGKLFAVNLKKVNILFFIPVIIGFVGFALAHVLTADLHANRTYGFMEQVLINVKKNPASYVLSFCLVIGPAIALLLFYWKTLWAYLCNNQPILIFTLLTLLLAFIGGADTERFVIWIMPVFLTVLGIIIEKNLPMLRKWQIAIPFILLQIIAYRLFFLLPEPDDKAFNVVRFPVLTIFGNHEYMNLAACYGKRSFMIMNLVEYIILIPVLIFMLYKFSKKQKAL